MARSPRSRETEPTDTGLNIGHPAPDAHRVSNLTLTLLLLTPASAWTVQLLAISSLGGATCMVGSALRGVAGGLLGPQIAMVPINVAALFLTLATLWLSIRTVRRIHRIREDERARVLRSRGEIGGEFGETVIDQGEGRARFLLAWSIFLAMLFSIAIVVNMIPFFWPTLCMRGGL